MFHGLKKVNFLQIDVYKFNTSPIKVLRKKKLSIKEIILKFIWKSEEAETTLRKKDKVEGFTLPNLGSYYMVKVYMYPTKLRLTLLLCTLGRYLDDRAPTMDNSTNMTTVLQFKNLLNSEWTTKDRRGGHLPLLPPN